MQVVLPESLKAFWDRYYYVAFGGYEFTTVEQLADRMTWGEGWRPSIPRNYLPILDDGGGGHYFVVAAKTGKPKPDEWGNVVFVSHEDPGTFNWVAGDFLDFAISVVRKRM